MSLLASHSEMNCPRQIGILSDIHANVTALQNALDILSDFRVDSFLVCGDIVGYGQDVNECCEMIRDLDCPTVAGNHDLAVTGKIPFETMFTKNAVDGVIYAKNIITKYNFDWLAGLPVRYENRYLEMAHASLNDPMAFKYLALGNCDDDSCWENVQLSFDAMRQKMGIIGHSHVPAIFFEHDSKKIDVLIPDQRSYELKDHRVIIDAGSVGQSRCPTGKASVCILNTLLKTVEFKKFQ